MTERINGSLVVEPYSEYVRTEWKLLARQRVMNPETPVRNLAEALGYAYITVRAWLREPAYQRYENWLIEQVKPEHLPFEVRGHKFVNAREMFQEFQVDMANRLFDIIESTGNERLRASLIQDWLDRAGVSGKNTDTKVGNTFVLTEEAMKVLLARAEEAGVAREPRLVTIEASPVA